MLVIEKILLHEKDQLHNSATARQSYAYHKRELHIFMRKHHVRSFTQEVRGRFYTIKHGIWQARIGVYNGQIFMPVSTKEQMSVLDELFKYTD